jgi:hypothetical protein
MKNRLLALALLAMALGSSGCANEPTSGFPAGSGGAGIGGASAMNGGATSTPGITCQTGFVVCGSSCVNTSSDVNNCGNCATKCTTGQECRASACQCLTGLSACSLGCADLKADAKNCGNCGNVCSAGQVCSNGSCTSGCVQGQTLCGSSCVDVATSSTHCGGCDRPCSIAGQSCSAGSCTCANGRSLCNGSCVDTAIDSTNCGACGNACASGATCTAGSCKGGATGTGGTSSTAATGGSSGSTTLVGGSPSTGGTSGVGGSSSVGGTSSRGGSSSAGGMTTAGGTTSAAGSTGGPKLGVPGVVVAIDSAGTLGCVQLCDGTTPSDPTVNPDWGYEGGASCIIKNTQTATSNLACTTGSALPTPNRNGLNGVVVATDSAGTLKCVPICTNTTTASGTDPSWGWEFQASCVLGGTALANCNQACKTGEALPSTSLIPARQGVMSNNVCVPLCACGVAGTDPSYGWEYQASCIMPTSTVATTGLACTTGTTQSYVPPALTCTKKADGFNVSNGRLLDACGNDFVIRGVNNPHAWFDTGNQYLAYRALDTIAGYKTNTIRVVWQTTGGTSAALLAQVLYRIVALKMVPMVELHDVTGKTTAAELTNMANYYASAEIKKVLLDFRAYLLINIANEWSGTDANYASAYTSAIGILRNAGILHTLVIDANNWGQNANVIFNNATTLMNADPQKNLLFSVHMYGMYPSTSSVDTVLDRAVTDKVALIVGEFGPQLAGQPVAWREVAARCQTNKLGYIPWSWKGNASPDTSLDMASLWPGPLTTWGSDIMVNDPNSIQRTAVKASIFP